MPYVKTRDNTSLYVHDTGPVGGIPVVLLHGWPLSHRMFEIQLAALPSLGYRCIAPDLRGFGRSDAPWGSYSHDQAADDLEDIADSLNLEKFILVGFSNGGAVAIRYASRQLARAPSKLVLLSAAAPSLLKREGWPHGMDPAKASELLARAKADRPAMVTAYVKQMFYRYHSPEFMAWLSSLGMEASLAGTLGVAAATQSEDMRRELSLLRGFPTAVFYGVHDRIVPRAASETLAAAIPGAALLRFDRSGHGLLFDETELFQQRLVEFISAAGSPTV